MEEFVYISRLIWLALWAVYHHPATPVALGLLRDVALFVLGGAAMHVLNERVFKRAVPPAPSPMEDALRGRVEALSRNLGRAEAERDAAREEAENARAEARTERGRADRMEAELCDALRPPRRRRPRARKRRRGWR